MIVAVAFSAFVVGQSDKRDFISIEDTDAMEYQLLAVNLSEFGRFPTVGFLEAPRFYGIDTAESLSLSNRVRLELTLGSGPVIGLGKPPLYPLLLASVYSVMGLDCRIPFWLNAIMMAITSFVVFLGVALALGGYSFFLRLPASVLVAGYYVYSVQPLIGFALPGPLIHLTVALLSCAVLLDRSHSWLSGVLLGLLLLTNGNMLPLAAAFILLLAVRWLKGSGRSPLVMGLATVLVVLPWSVYANVQLSRSAEARKEWREAMFEDTLPLAQTQPGFDRRARSGQDSLITRLIINRMYSRYADDGFVILSKQPFGDEILSVHNEYAVDGSWHPEWRYVVGSYHNNENQGRTLLSRVILFYWDNPEFLWLNSRGKLLGVIHPHIHLLFLSMVFCAGFVLLPYTSLRAYFLFLVLYCCAYMAFGPLFQGLSFVLFTLLAAVGAIFGSGRRGSDILVLLTSGAMGVVAITFIFIGVPRYSQTIGPLVLIALAHMIGQMGREAQMALSEGAERSHGQE